MIHKILFKENNFHPGLNVTVRNGSKWQEVTPGDVLDIRQTQTGEQINAGRVVLAVPAKRGQIPDEWLRFEHAPGARTQEGLDLAMKNAYGDYGPDLTVLFFWI